MADFSTWQRDTLEQFAREATDKLVANRFEIAELVGMLQQIINSDLTVLGVHEYTQAKDLITKHDLSTKE